LYQKDFVHFNFPIPVCPQEQTAIATVLSDTDELITSLDKLITKKKAIEQGAMQELLTGKKRLPGFEKQKGFKQTELGEIPEDWEVKTIGDIVRVIGGGSFKSTDSKNIGVRWLKIANVSINKILWNEESHLPINFIQEYNNFLLNAGDCVIALTRPLLDRKLKIAKIEKKDSPALLNQRVGKIQVEGNNSIDFIYYIFQKNEVINNLLQSMVGTDPPNLSNRGIYNIDIAVPSNKQEQTAIATVLSEMDSELESLEKKRDKYLMIKQGMMQQLLTGKIRLI
jgi:type I restriction enzyme S subunit